MSSAGYGGSTDTITNWGYEMTVHNPLVTTATADVDLRKQVERLRIQQRQLLDWLDSLVIEAKNSESAIVVVGAAVVKSQCQQLADGLQIHN